MNSTSLDPKSLRAASLTGRDTDRGPGVNNFFSLPGELTATVYRLKININVSFFKNPIFITNIYNYSIKLQVIIIFYFYHFDTHELMSQEKRSFLILYVGQWVYIFFLFREDEACFAISLCIQWECTKCIYCFFNILILCNCCIKKKYFLKGQRPFCRKVCQNLTCVSNNWVIYSVYKSLFCLYAGQINTTMH